MRPIKTLKQAIDLSVLNSDQGEIDADLKIKVNGETWDCYTVHVNQREFLCYCNQGTASFVVDSYGDRNTCELLDWENDNETR